MSTRSSSGPEIFERYFCTDIGGQMHWRATSPRWPHGQGFVAQIPWQLTAPTPKPRYPKQIKHLGGHLRAKRIDLGLLQKEVAVRIGVATATVTNWELGNTEPEERFIPALITFLGHNPLPEPRSLGEAVRRARLSRGWPQAKLAEVAGVDPATVTRLEADTKGMAGRSVEAALQVLGLQLHNATRQSTALPR